LSPPWDKRDTYLQVKFEEPPLFNRFKSFENVE
jgi:hypothetical protein